MQIHHTVPAQTYPEAIAQIELIQQRDTREWRDANQLEALNPKCTTSLLSHGKKSKNSVVLIHGLTNCPSQFSLLGQQLYELGYNVLVPRLPEHGHANRMTKALAKLHTEHMFSVVDKAVDAAQGLGEQVIVVGFSLGGVLASWLTQCRSDIDKSIIISPALRTAVIPAWANDLFANFLAIWPNQFLWWDPKQKLEYDPVPHAYPRFSTRSLAHMLKSGATVRKMAKMRKPAAKSITMVINPADEAVDGVAIRELIELWRAHGAVINVYKFDPSWKLIHDLIDPIQPEQQTDRVYPILLDLIRN